MVTGTYPREFLALPDEVARDHHGAPPALFPGGRRRWAASAALPRGHQHAARQRRAHRPQCRARARRPPARRTLLLGRGPGAAARGPARPPRTPCSSTSGLGSYRAKAERTAELAERIAGEVLGRPAAAAAARGAAVLSKADLATDMVGEFPELQGRHGGASTRREEGEPGAGLEGPSTITTCRSACGRPTPPVASGSGPGGDLVGGRGARRQARHGGRLVRGPGRSRPDSRDPLGIRRQAQGMLRILIDLPELTGLKARAELGPAAGDGGATVTPRSRTRRPTAWRRFCGSASGTCSRSGDSTSATSGR